MTKLAAKLGVEVVGEAIEGVFGLASATVTAAGEAAKGVGMAVGGALEGALSPAPITIINSVGMAGGAGKAKVTGGGTIPAGPKKSAKPAVNSRMATEKLLVIAVNYLSSIEKTLVDQLNFERIAASQQAQAQREAAIEGGGGSPYKSLGEKLGAVKEAGADKVATATKVILGGAALASLGLLGLGQLDTSELSKLKQNWQEFQSNIEPLLKVVRQVQEFIGDEPTLGAAIGLAIAGPKGGIVGLIAGLVYGLTESPELAAAAAAAGFGLTFTKPGRKLAVRGAVGAAKLVVRGAAALGPIGGAAVSATGLGLAAIDTAFKSTQTDVQKEIQAFYSKYGLYAKFSDNGLTTSSFSIVMPKRNTAIQGIKPSAIASSTRATDKYYYWKYVVDAAQKRGGTATRAQAWLNSPEAKKWLDTNFPLTTATAVAPAAATPDATPSETTSTTSATAGSNKVIIGVIGGGAGYTEVRYADGTTERRGGTLPARANNPGNIMYGDLAISLGAVGSSPSTNGPPVAVFPTREAGFVALDAQLSRPKYSDGPIGETIKEWATDPTHPSKVLATSGVDPNKSYSDFNKDEKVRFMQALAKVEGYYAAGSGPKISSNGENSMLSSLGDLGKRTMEAVGNILRAGLGPMTSTSGSQLSGFNDNMQERNVATPSMSTIAAPVQGENTSAAKITQISTQLQNAVDLGNTGSVKATTQKDSTGSTSIRKANSSNDGKLECLNPNFPGNGSVESYLQYHKLAA